MKVSLTESIVSPKMEPVEPLSSSWTASSPAAAVGVGAGANEDMARAEEKEDESAPRTTALSPLDGLSKEMREVYALLQKGTARGRLLAEQVSYTAVCPCAKLINVITSSIRRIPVLSLYALASRKRTVLKHAVLRTTTTNP